MELIDRDALLEAYDREHVGAAGRARKLIEDAPAIDSSDYEITLADFVSLLDTKVDYSDLTDRKPLPLFVECFDSGGHNYYIELESMCSYDEEWHKVVKELCIQEDRIVIRLENQRGMQNEQIN